jgi:hypothetical protein
MQRMGFWTESTIPAVFTRATDHLCFFRILSAFAGFVGTTVDSPPLHWMLIERRLQC